MTAFNVNSIKSETLQQIVKFYDDQARQYYAEGYASNDYNEVCLNIGALSAVLELLAEKMGGLWLYGADFVEDAEQVRAFVAMILERAEKLGEIAEVDNINIVREAAAKVELWLKKGAEQAAQFAEAVETAEEQTAEEQTAEEITTAEEQTAQDTNIKDAITWTVSDGHECTVILYNNDTAFVPSTGGSVQMTAEQWANMCHCLNFIYGAVSQRGAK